MNARIDPFQILKEPPEFAPKPRREKPVANETIQQIAKDNNFVSRQAPKTPAKPRRQPRRYRTGRNQHLGIKATAETIERFYKAVDERSVPSGELLRLALDALDKAGGL